MLDWLLRRRVGLFLVLWVGVLLLLHSLQQSYLAHDEGYYAQQARWILLNNDWLTVQWWGQLIYDRTLTIQWLVALSFSLFGFSERAARLPSMLACVGAVLLTWRIGLHLSPKQVGGWGAAILVVTPIWMQASDLAVQDIVLVFLELAGIWALLAAEQRRASGRFWLGLLAGTTVGLGFLVKTFMIVLPVVALLPYLVLEQPRHRHLSNRGLYLGLPLGFVPFGVWMGLSVNRYGSLPLEHLFGKIVALSENYFEIYTTPLFYLWNIPANSFPWAFFAIAGFVLVWRAPGLNRKLLWLGYPLILFVLLTLFRTRTWYYPLQLYPFTALLSAYALNHLTQRYLSDRPYQRRPALLLSWLVGGVAILMLVAGILVLLAPLPELVPFRAYGWIGLGAGLGWLVPFGVMLRDRTQPWISSRGELWRLGWLLGPWLAIAALFATGLWGNYAPDVKTALEAPPFQPVLAQQKVHFVRPDPRAGWVLLTAYTPNLGDRVDDLGPLVPGEYAWIEAGQAPTDGPPYQVLGQVRDWQLVQIQEAPPPG
jgi:4-amino-4-deoxy-L-arabinose transferase-like glycosyltransferase